MKKLMLLVLLLLTVCSSVFAESIDDVLKDCKLDRNRWKIVEWFKSDRFVRFYDSESVSVTGPGQFETIIYDYFYSGICNSENCKQRGNKHYHSEKVGFNATKSTSTLRSISTKDSNENVIDSYDYPIKLQIASEFDKKSIEAKTMLKIKDSLKNNKEFTKEVKPKQEIAAKNTTPLPKIKGLVPMPMVIGASDGEWTYLGRFIAPPNFSSLLEWETRMKRYTANVESNNLYDVYYYHSHYGDGDGHGCYMVGGANGSGWHYSFACVIKCVTLDQNARPKNLSGINNGVHLLSMGGMSKGAFSAGIGRWRVFDSVTHQVLVDDTRNQNAKLNGSFRDYEHSELRYGQDSPFYIAMHMTTSCPVKPNPIP